MHSDLLLLDLIRLAALLIVALAYALFDVFNRRNVPDMFAYATLAIGIVITLTYPLQTIEFSALCAVIIASLGYATYRTGILGAGDTFEFLFISLVLPVQALPALVNLQQFSLPFILSVFIATGYATIILTPAYYIIKARRKNSRLIIEKKGTIAATLLVIVYIILIAALGRIVSDPVLVAVVMLIIAVPSAVILAFRRMIYEGMTEMVYPSQLEQGDMIAVSMMGKRDLAYFRKRSRHFERLATSQLIRETKRIRRKIPVYKNAIPLALFTFIGVIISLLVGNIVLLLIL